MIEVVPVCVCPWCKKTPSFNMLRVEDTWTPRVVCENPNCLVKPAGPYVPIRKHQKYDHHIIRDKILHCIRMWNYHNPCEAKEGFEFDFCKVAEEEKRYTEGHSPREQDDARISDKL